MAQVDAALEQRSSTFRSNSGKRTYIVITKRITSGDELKWRNGFRDVLICSRRQRPPPARQVASTEPFDRAVAGHFHVARCRDGLIEKRRLYAREKWLALRNPQATATVMIDMPDF